MSIFVKEMLLLYFPHNYKAFVVEYFFDHFTNAGIPRYLSEGP